MPRETIYRCARPGCDRSVRSIAPAPPLTFLLVQERDANGGIREIDLCSWDCAMKLAATDEPPSEFPADL